VIRLVALDMAGTTVDEGGAVYQALSDTIEAVTGRPVAHADLARWQGADKREAITGLLSAGRGTGEGDPDARVVDDAFADFSARLDNAYLSEPPKPIDGVEAAFVQLRAAGVAIALTTGFSRRVASGLLDGLGWEAGRTIDVVVTAEDVGEGRPSPRMIQRAMELTGVRDPAEVLAAGDTLLDLEAGANAGIAAVVGVLTGAQDRATLESGPSTHVIASVSALPQLLATIDGGLTP
jgi:phosphonatase-like hydrolase